MRCWGQDASGQLGVTPDERIDAECARGPVVTPLPSPGARDHRGVGPRVREDRVHCWGRKTWGELAAPSSDDVRAMPAPIARE